MRHSKVQVKALSAYSNSFKFICRGDIPIGSSLVVDLSTLLPNPSACPHIGVWDKPWNKFANYFETASSQFRFCPEDKKRASFGARNRPKWTLKRLIVLFGACLAK